MAVIQREVVTENSSYPTSSSVGVSTIGYKLRQVVWLVFGLLELLLLFRILFELLGANGGAFTNFIYHYSLPLVRPFQGIFPASSVQGSFLDSAAILAMVVLSVLSFIITSILDVIFD